MVVSLIALMVPVTALASGGGNCKASACQIYTEGPGSPAGGNGRQDTGPVSSATTVKPVPISSTTRHVLAKAGKDKQELQNLVSEPSYGAQHNRLLDRSAMGVTAPSALGAAFDLGAGPTVLLAILLATVVALAAHGGVRSWRERRSRA